MILLFKNEIFNFCFQNQKNTKNLDFVKKYVK